AGSGMNVAQRVLDCGDAGHILVSKHVVEDLVQSRRWKPYLYDLGEYKVKHGLRLHLFNFCKDGLGNLQTPEKLKHRRWKQGVAVLPFDNLSEEKENAYFTDGVQGEILTDLAKVADLKVISRTSVLQYGSGAERNVRQIGEQLGVANVVEGNVQRSGNRVR